jgi:hypothetical protein
MINISLLLITFISFLIKHITTQTIITIPLEDKLSISDEGKSQLHLNITSTYQVPINTLDNSTILKMEPFLSQFPPNQPPHPLKNISILKFTLTDYFIPLKLFNLNTPIDYFFHSYDKEFVYSFKGEYLCFPREQSEYQSGTSLIHQLFYANIIPNKQFILDLNNKHKEEFLYLGGIPKQISNNIKQEYIVDISSSKMLWKADVKFFTIGYKHYKLNTEWVIDLYEREISVSTMIFNSIISNHFRKLINQTECWLWYPQSSKVICKDNVVKNFGKVFFYIGNVSYEFNKDPMFSCNGVNNCTFNIIKNINGVWDFRLGYMFFKNFVSVFDYDNEVVVMYKKDEMNLPNERDSIKNICEVLVVINLVMVVWLFFVRKKNGS